VPSMVRLMYQLKKRISLRSIHTEITTLHWSKTVRPDCRKRVLGASTKRHVKMTVEISRHVLNNTAHNADLPVSKNRRRQNKAMHASKRATKSYKPLMSTDACKNCKRKDVATGRQTNVRSPHYVPHPSDIQNKGSQNAPGRHVLQARAT
jgi:hypothetical protein